LEPCQTHLKNGFGGESPREPQLWSTLVEGAAKTNSPAALATPPCILPALPPMGSAWRLRKRAEKWPHTARGVEAEEGEGKELPCIFGWEGKRWWVRRRRSGGGRDSLHLHCQALPPPPGPSDTPSTSRVGRVTGLPPRASLRQAGSLRRRRRKWEIDDAQGRGRDANPRHRRGVVPTPDDAR
jgi:hypothetical protein